MPYPFDPEDTIGPEQENWSQQWDGHPVLDPPPDLPPLQGWNDLPEEAQEDPYMQYAFSTQRSPYAWNRLASDDWNVENNWNYNALGQVRDYMQKWIMPQYKDPFNATPWVNIQNPLQIAEEYGGQQNASAFRQPSLVEIAGLPDYPTMMHETAHTFGPGYEQQFYDNSNNLPQDQQDALRYRFDYIRQMESPQGREQYWNIPAERYAAMAEQPYLIPDNLRWLYPWLNFDQGIYNPGTTTAPNQMRKFYDTRTRWDQ